MAAAPSTRVLVVEDEPDLADLYADWLADTYRVEICYEGQSAIEALDDGVDVVLLDRRMPDLSGDEVLSEIRRRGIDCRVAMVTAVTPEEDILEMGFDDYLVKPVAQGDVRGVVERLIRRSQHTDKVREFFALASKKGVLEAEGSASDERIAALAAELEETAAAVDASLEDLEAEDYEVLFYDLADDALVDPVS